MGSDKARCLDGKIHPFGWGQARSLAHSELRLDVNNCTHEPEPRSVSIQCLREGMGGLEKSLRGTSRELGAATPRLQITG